MIKFFSGALLGGFVCGVITFGWLAYKLAPVMRHFVSLPKEEQESILVEFEKTKPRVKATE